MGLFSYIFASDNARNIKKLKVIADKVVALEEEYSKLSDEELKNKTNIFKERLNNGETLNGILPEAFATVREASYRVLKMKHFYVQIIGGICLHQGRIAEMKTGEGKTLVETLPAYLNALSGNGVHIITVNEYLASRDSEWMGKIFNFLGLTVGITLSGMNQDEKRKAYAADITYGTNSEMGFDYLRDNMLQRKEDFCQRGLNFAIIDEVDSILIDEARTPLIISGGQGMKAGDVYYTCQKFVRTLVKEKDFELDEEKKITRLTEDGIEKAEKYFKVENLSSAENMELNHYILNALKANFLFELNSHYIVEDGQILIVDEFTGRILKGRRYSDGLHQAIEAKEGVEINEDNLTVATITYQNYFRLYKKLSGMTGTAKTEETEFNKIYDLDVVTIPTNNPIQRKDNNDIVFANVEAKFNAIVKEIKARHEKGQPILVGTTTVEKSELLSKLLVKHGIKHNCLNAKNHMKESEIIAQAGKLGAVTISTNMAGRGTDILLGGNAEFLAKQKMRNEGFSEELINLSTSFADTNDEEILKAKEKYQKYYNEFKIETDKEKEKVIEAGGLFVLGTERHESRRIDNQLRGRAGRQGDKGESTFFISLEDDLVRIFGGDRLKSVVNFFKLDENEPIFNMKLISKQIEMAQKRVEAANFAARRNVISFDDVLNAQRKIIYNERNKVINGESVHDEVVSMIDEYVTNLIEEVINDDIPSEKWDIEKLNKILEQEEIFNDGQNFVTQEMCDELEVNEIVQKVLNEVHKMYDTKIRANKEQIGIDFGNIERNTLLRYVDKAWVEHIDNMSALRRDISTRQDPLLAYKNEGYDMFENMISNIRTNTAKYLLKREMQIILSPEEAKRILAKLQIAVEQSNKAKKAVITHKKEDVGRNDPCPCGSGKKYKQCCGK
ncbi:MAG: preprotein translocase subunit SecA [Clostridiales bacterium]|nr:preprotein translocase subunit SecA [Clostridiales bacterium]